ncbi:MAG: hypothetical protein U9R06_03155 [Patescibacteria group bacterium]|nr:hypothetical protein [Patescibacteria group bacterium]
MRLINKIFNFFNSKQGRLYLLVFIIALSLFTYLHFDQTFADPDSFYHAKMPSILMEQGAITEFPWLSATNLKYNFIDHHFLYHLALIPFVELFPPLFGLKIATIILSSLAILIIFWFLKQLKVRGAFWYIIFLLTINPFIFRLNLAKAQALVLIFLFLIIYLIFNRRYLSLMLVSALYVWLYGGWPLILLIVGLYVIISWIKNLSEHKNWLINKIGKVKLCRQGLWLVFNVLAGLLAGLFFSPYFPKNLNFYWQQSFKIAVLNYQHLIGVGGEWYPYDFPDLLAAALPFFVLFLFALVIFFSYRKKQSVNGWLFLFLSFLFFGLTLKSRRYVEYFIPLAVCFSALSITSVIDSIKSNLAKLMPKKLLFLLPLLILLVFSPFFVRDIRKIKRQYSQGYSFDRFIGASQWLKQNSNPGDIVFHSDWDEFPFLFYHNDENYYLVGLDPTFMYDSDKDLYQRWVDIVNGNEVNKMYFTIKEIFDASYVFVDMTSNQPFAGNMDGNFYFEKVFEDESSRVYRVN